MDYIFLANESEAQWYKSLPEGGNCQLLLRDRKGSPTQKLAIQPTEAPVFEEQLNSVVSKEQRTDSRFIKDFNTIKNLIDRGIIGKGVAYNTLEIELGSAYSPTTALRGMGTIPRDFFKCFICQENSGFAVLTPEWLLKANKAGSEYSYQTMSLAGTSWDDSGLLEIESTEQEQSFVTQHIVQQLQQSDIPYSLGDRFLQDYGKLKHIKQQLIFKTHKAPKSIDSMLAPTPAVAFYPKEAANDIWSELEFNREKQFDWYGGSLMIDKTTHAESIVLIRGIQWKNNKVWIHAGCGIVAESNLERELQESKEKIAQVREFFGL